MEDILTEWIPFGLGLVAVLFSYLVYRRLSSTETESREDNSNDLRDDNEVSKIAVPKQKKIPIEKRKETKDSFTHPWLVSNLKGHSAEISDLDFSSNGKHLISCANDRSVLMWSVKTFADKNHRSVRANIEFDHATRVKWSPDGKAFIVSLGNDNSIQVYKIAKRKDGSLGNAEAILKFDQLHKLDILNIGIACNGQFIMSCSSDTTLVVWGLKGEVLATIDTLHINNYYACVSPCGRFVASSGFTPDVRVWEVSFLKNGEFKEVKRAFELKGHTSGVFHFDFSNDSSRMVTISKDKTWKLWDTNIEYNKGQEPYLLKSVNYGTTAKSLISLSPDGRTISIATASDISIYSAVTGDIQMKIEEVHPNPLTVLTFSPDGKYFIVAAGRHIRIFHNVPGYKNLILGLKEVIKTSTNATMKERLQSQIEETQFQGRIKGGGRGRPLPLPPRKRNKTKNVKDPILFYFYKKDVYARLRGGSGKSRRHQCSETRRTK